MPLITLGLSGSLNHDPSAALFIDGKLVAAAEEERFIRDKHAKGKMPYHATRFCMEYAGIEPHEIDIIAVKDEVLHFIEVKSGSSFEPLYNITPKKLQHVINTAYRFMQKKNLDLAFQIDAISVQNGSCELTENITL